MYKFHRILILAVITATGVTKGQLSCEDGNNGGCSHICLYRGGLDGVECACPCGMKLDTTNNKTCIAIMPCNVDMLALFDGSQLTDMEGCAYRFIPTLATGFVEWKPWRNLMVNFFQEYVNDADSGSLLNVGSQIYSRRATIETVNNYTGNLAMGLSDIMNRMEPTCQSSSYLIHLRNAVEQSPLVDFVYKGPGVRRNPNTTTRVAIAFASQFYFFDESAAQTLMAVVRPQMDAFIVIGRNTSVETEERMNRFVACGNFTQTPCERLFYVDKPNDLGLILNRTNVDSTINYDACMARQSFDEMSKVHCGTQMTIEIPKCLMKGLLPRDLAYLHSACGIEVVSETDAAYVLMIPFAGCGIMTSLTVVGGVPSIQYTQKLTTRMYAPNQTLPNVTFHVSCTYPRQLSCEDGNNGGCSHICLYRGGLDGVECACPCGMKLDTTNNKTCIAIMPCNVDMLALFDGSQLTDMEGCAYRFIPTLATGFVEWKPWRNLMVNFFQEYVNDADSGSLLNVGSQIYSRRATIETVNNYTGNLAMGLSDIMNRMEPTCQSSSYLIHLRNAVEQSPLVDFVYKGPGVRRNPNTTTRVAIAFASQFYFFGESAAQTLMSVVRPQMDAFIVIGRNTSVETEERMNRFVACGSFTQTPCERLFYVDKPNDLGLILNRTNVDSTINYDACMARQSFDEMPNVHCGTQMTIEIPKCLMKGLLPRDLAYLHSACGIEVVSETDAAYVLMIPFAGCGIMTSVTVVDGVPSIQYTQKLVTRMYAPNQTLPNVTFHVSCTYPRQLSCEDGNNGGCSHICLYRGGLDGAECACPCGLKLDTTNNKTCIAIMPCNVDMLALFDGSELTDTEGCAYKPFPTFATGFVEWKPWRNLMVNFFQEYVNDADSGSLLNVGSQIYSRRATIETVNNYTGNLAMGLSDIMNRMEPTCQSSSYLIHLRNAVEQSPLVGFVYKGPGVRRNPNTTTRVAIAFASQFYFFDESAAQTLMSVVRPQMDAFIVIGRNTSVEAEERMNRFVACGSFTQTPCERLFYVDKPNDLGLILNRTNVDSTINYDACMARQSFDEMPKVYCGTQMTIEIPKCLMKGLLPRDLAYLYSACMVRVVSETDAACVLMIPFAGCGIMTSLTVVDGVPSIQYTQKLTTRMYAPTQTLPNVTFHASCTYPAPTTLPPPTVTVSAATVVQSRSGLDGVGFNIYKDSAFSAVLPPGECIEVNCPLYFEITTNLPSTLAATLWSCHATPALSPSSLPSYSIFSMGCSKDPTLTPVASNNATIRFCLKMFEFSSDYYLPKDDKSQVYIHCSVMACMIGDTSARCNPACPSSRRRRAIEEADLKTVTLGPFYVTKNKEKVLSEKTGDANERKMENIIVEKIFDMRLLSHFVYMFILVCLIFMTANKIRFSRERAGKMQPKREHVDKNIEEKKFPLLSCKA